MSQLPRVFVARIIPTEGLDLVRGGCDADVWEDDLPPPRDELLRRVAGCDGVLTLLTDRVDDEFLDAAGPRLRVVSNYAVGFDNIDVAACARRGVAVGNTPGVLTDTTADLAWALLMAAARRLTEGDRYVRDGRWKTWGPLLLLGPDVHGATIGIVGFGRIGQAVARRAQGFGMEILYHDVQPVPDEVTMPLGATYLPLEALLPRSDFVSLHVNLSELTRHLMNATTLTLMKPTAILVNTSRGPVVDQRALADALRDGTIAAAALDVTDPEPISMDDPLVGLDNCLIVPHIASASRATRGRMAAMAAANLLAGVRGQPLPTPVPPSPEILGLHRPSIVGPGGHDGGRSSARYACRISSPERAIRRRSDAWTSASARRADSGSDAALTAASDASIASTSPRTSSSTTLDWSFRSVSLASRWSGVVSARARPIGHLPVFANDAESFAWTWAARVTSSPATSWMPRSVARWKLSRSSRRSSRRLALPTASACSARTRSARIVNQPVTMPPMITPTKPKTAATITTTTGTHESAMAHLRTRREAHAAHSGHVGRPDPNVIRSLAGR